MLFFILKAIVYSLNNILTKNKEFPRQLSQTIPFYSFLFYIIENYFLLSNLHILRYLEAISIKI